MCFASPCKSECHTGKCHIIADQVRNDGSGSVMLASRQYPQGGEGETSPKQPLTVIADLIRNPEGGWRGAIRSVMLALSQHPYCWLGLFCLAVTLTFDSSPIKGEGVCGWSVLLSPSPLIPLPSRERG